MKLTKLRQLLAKVTPFVLVIFLVAIGLLFFFTDTKNQITQKAEIYTPQIPKEKNQQLNTISTTITKNDYVSVKNMNTYRLVKDQIDSREIEVISTNFGYNSFLQEPLKLTDATEGEILIWKDESTYLRIATDLLTVDYKVYTNNSLGNFGQVSTDQIEAAANEIMAGFDFLDPNSYQARDVKFFNLLVEDPKQVVPDKANIAEISFDFTVEGVKVANYLSEIGTATIRLNSNLELVSVYMILPPQVGSILSSVKIKNYQNFLAELPNATIQTINDGDPYNEYNYDSITSIEVDVAELAYLRENNPNQQILLPILVLTGSAQIGIATHDVTLYLPAVATQ